MIPVMLKTNRFKLSEIKALLFSKQSCNIIKGFSGNSCIFKARSTSHLLGPSA